MLLIEDLAEINGLIAALLTQQVDGNIGKGILEAYSGASNFKISFRSDVLIFVRKSDGFMLTVDVSSKMEKRKGPMVA